MKAILAAFASAALLAAPMASISTPAAAQAHGGGGGSHGGGGGGFCTFAVLPPLHPASTEIIAPSRRERIHR